MATFKRFEEIKSWQKARELTKLVYQVTSEGHFAKDYGLRDQIRRSSVSIMANIAEGYGRLSDKEFANFLNIARGSVAEVQSHLYVALDLAYISQENFSKLYELLEEIGRMIVALAKHLRGIPN
jgi:four helix bundle protein